MFFLMCNGVLIAFLYFSFYVIYLAVMSVYNSKCVSVVYSEWMYSNF